MGVPKFYRWISERFPCLSETVKDHQIPEFDNLYLDMNGIIHVCSHPDDGNAHFRITEEKIFTDVFHYLEVLFRMIKPRKVFFMAIDGVAPRAKMNQQRGRRFRSAKDAENLEKQALSRGETLPTEARFDSNCITPGTEFMVRLHTQLQYFIVNKMSHDKLWRDVRVYLSGHETPGEGEHKIMDFIRSEKIRPDYDANTRHCLYGLDADLIMLGLTTHEPHFALLREEVRFGKQSQKRSNTVEETTFHLLHISLLREYLDLEFASVKHNLVSFEYDLERIIDDWVLMGFLVGNDFIPHLPHLHIAQDALPTIWSTYKQTLPLMGGYINDKGKIDISRLETFLVALSEYDQEKFSEGYADLQWAAGKSTPGGAGGRGRRKGRNNRPGNQQLQEETMDVSALDDFTNGLTRELEAFDDENMPKPYIPQKLPGEDTLSYEFRKHKSAYYFSKMELQATDDVLAQQAKDYVLGLQWILYYYYTGVPSWGWFFPHHYAPYMSDLHSFSDIEIELDPGVPFMPFQQLMAVLPSGSKELLPDAYVRLMLSEASPIIDFYPPEFEFDMNGKQQDWEAVVLIPFIEEKRLLEAMGSVEHQLTAAEKARNGHGPCLIYDYTTESQGVYSSTLSSFPDIAQNHTKVSKKTWKDFVIPADQLRGGLCDDVKPALFYPGFPTFKHLEHRSYLQKMGVTVFQQASRNENRIVQLLDDMDIDNIDIMALGEELLGQSIWVDWPHMYEAKVCTVETDDSKVELGGKDKSEIVKSGSEGNSQAVFMSLVESITERYEKRRGLDIGPTFVLIHAQPIMGRKYIYMKDGRVTVDKMWQPTSVPYVLQACVRNEKMLECGVDQAGSMQFFSLPDVFPVDSRVYLLAHPYYGSEGRIVNHPEDRVRVEVTTLTEPDLTPAVQYNDEEGRYMRAYELAQHLGVSSHFISRITGTLFLSRGRETINIGLDLKNNKKNEECPGYTRKEGDDWLYSRSTEEVLCNFLTKYEDFLIHFVHENLSKDRLSADLAFPTDTSTHCTKLTDYMKSLPTYKSPRAKSGGRYLELPTVKKIEKAVERLAKSKMKHQTITVKPSLIYKQFSMTSTMNPDPNAEYQLFDRVVNVRLGYTVPFGLRGTVIGIITHTDPRDSQIEVVFDSPFPCGMVTRCSVGRGYRCPPHALINVSYGQRAAKSKGLKTADSNSKLAGSANTPNNKSNRPLRAQTSTYSTALSQQDQVGDKNKSNNSNHSSSSSPKPRQMQLLRRPDGAKPKSSNERGAFLKPTNQVKPTVKESPKAATNSGQQNGRNIALADKQRVPSPAKPVRKQEVAPAVAPIRTEEPAKSSESGPAGPMLMKPSEFVTPRTAKLDGRNRNASAEKLDHADIWSKLKVVNSQPGSEAKPSPIFGGASNAPAADASMSQALAALNNIKIAPSPSKPSSSTTMIVENSQLAYSSPKAGEKIDLQSIFGSGEKQSQPDTKPKKASKQAKRELYVAGKGRQVNEAPQQVSQNKMNQTRTPTSSPNPQQKPPAGQSTADGFNFELLVSALEKNQTSQELDKILTPTSTNDSNTGNVEDDDPIARLTAQLEKSHLNTSQQGVPSCQPPAVPTDDMLVGRQIPVQHVAPVPIRPMMGPYPQPAHPGMRLPPPLGMVGHHTQYMPAPQPARPTNDQILRQWAMSNRLPPPSYMMNTVTSPQGFMAIVSTVTVGNIRMTGPPQPDQLAAAEMASWQAILHIQRQGPNQIPLPVSSAQPQNSAAPPQGIMAPGNVKTSPVPPSQAQRSSFVPLQVTKKHVHEERIRTSSESQTAAVNETNHAAVAQSTELAAEPTAPPPQATASPQPGTGSTTATPKNKPKKSNTPKKPKAKVRLAANFGPGSDT